MDEENNNEEQKQPGVVEQGIKEGATFVKNKAKKGLFDLIKPFLPQIISAIGTFFLILLAIGVIMVIPFLIQEAFKALLGIFLPDSADSETSAGASSSVTSAETVNIVYLGENGEYKLSVEDFAEKILEDLETQKVDNEALGFSTDEFGDMIDKYIKAEVQTTYPETGALGNEFDGIIKIYRAPASGGAPILLKYKPYDDFKKLGETEILKFFSLTEDFKLCIARYGDSDNNIKIEEIEYKKYVQNYSVPLNFFVALHVMSQDTKFMNEFVDMVLGNDKMEPIVLTYVESSGTTTIKRTYDGTLTTTKEIIDTSFTELEPEPEPEPEPDPDPGTGKPENPYLPPGTVILPNSANNMPITYELTKKPTNMIPIDPGDGTGGDTGVIIEESRDMTDEEIEGYYEKKKEKKPTYNEGSMFNSGTLEVTNADTWLMTSNKSLNWIDNTVNDNNDSYIMEDEEVYKGTYTKTIEKANVRRIDTWEEKRYATITEHESVKSTTYRYTIVDGESKIAIDEPGGFIDLIEKYPKVKNNLTTAPSTLLYLLQQNENTQQLEKIMRYVIYKLTGTDYGVTDVSFLKNLFNTSLKPIRGTSTENYIKAWENNSLWLYETNQSETFPARYLTEDGANYIVYEDGSKGHNNIAYGWATFISNSDGEVEHPTYGKGYYNWKKEFATEGITVEILKEGDYVDKNLAIAVFQNHILPYFQNNVKNYLESHLPEYEFSQAQKDALISICYQYGNILGFADAYRNCLNTDGSIDAEQLRNSYSRFDYTSTINDRKYANWLLFTQEKYIDRAGNEIKLGGSLLEAAYAVADHFMNSGVDVHYAGNSVPGATNNGRIVLDKIVDAWELPIKQPDKYGVVCATFVSLAIWYADLIDEDTINYYGFNSCSNDVDPMLTQSKYADEWEIIESWEELQEGDIVWMEGHIYFYIAENQYLDQNYCVKSSSGTDSRGKLQSGQNYKKKFIKGYRYIGK